MPALYQLALLGEPTADQSREVGGALEGLLAPMGLALGSEVGYCDRPTDFVPPERVPSAALFFGRPGAVLPEGIGRLVARVPIVPVVSDARRVSADLPEPLRHLNALVYPREGPERVASALLECVGLLPRFRRVFLSYRRDEARDAALQLFNAFSARQFDVFLDTHGVAPGADFQATLWHRLCDSDVLVMLDTPTYFASRWTAAEFGRALAKSISVLRVEWPGVVASPRVSTTTSLALRGADIAALTGCLADDVVGAISRQLELVRSESVAVRRLNLLSGLEVSVTRIGGRVDAVGLSNSIAITLPDARRLVAYPAIGVPTSVTLQRATEMAGGGACAVVFDHIGVGHEWLEHLEWLGGHVKTPRWIRAAEAAWQLADWED